jgi:hypothetical protein
VIEQDRELLRRLRATNHGLAQSVVELLQHMENNQLAAGRLRDLADDLEDLVVGLRKRADQLDNTVECPPDRPPTVDAPESDD